MDTGTKNVAKEAMKLKLNIIKSSIEYDTRTPMGRMGKPDEIARMALVEPATYTAT
jgi:NAD(P)-dependent dehydrogenase (short-subunit alcohol dehydrogenase family)